MATATIDTLRDKAASVAAETTRYAETLAKDARAVRTRAAEAVEDGVDVARRTFDRHKNDLVYLQEDTAKRVKRAPLAAVGVTFAAGLLLGAIIGWLGHRPPAPQPKT